MSIHERFKKLPDLLGFSNRSQLARALDFTPQALSKVEKGGSPGYDLLHKIVTTFPIDAHWLLTGEGESTRKDDIKDDIEELPPTTITQTQYQELLQKVDQLSREVEGLKKDET